MKARRPRVAVVLFAAVWGLCSSADGGAIVLVNRTAEKIVCAIALPDGRQIERILERDDVTAMPAAGAVDVTFNDGVGARRQSLAAGGIYGFRPVGNKIELWREKIPGQPALAGRGRPSTAAADPDALILTVPVAILVDDQEPRVQQLWEKQYRERIAAASAIFERCCRVRFDVVAVGRWNSPEHVRGFDEVLAAFERNAPPRPAWLAIGFTGHYNGLRDDIHMGGTRGPFRPHILIREWGHGVTEPERLEMLAHELGHYLGAAHSAERQSVMRPDLSDRQSRAKNFRIRFDAPDALAMCLIAEEMRDRPLAFLGQVSPAVREQLRPIYQWLAKSLPNDPAAPQYLRMLDGL